jgi:hypothetical protein
MTQPKRQYLIGDARMRETDSSGGINLNVEPILKVTK